jgi:hypothetical protein
MAQRPQKSTWAEALRFDDAEEDKEDEEVVDGEGLFDGVAGEILCASPPMCGR